MKTNQTPVQEFKKVIDESIANYYSRAHSARIKRGLAAKKIRDAKVKNG